MSTKTYREKSLVLCLFDYWSKFSGGTQTVSDSIMVEVEFLDQVPAAFQTAVARQKRIGWPVGPMPCHWELTGYTTKSGSKYL